MGTLATIIGVILLAIAAAVIVVFLFVPLAKLITKLLAHLFGTIGRWITDIFRLVGTILVIPVFMLLTVLSVIVGRWSASSHYGRAVSGEIKSAGLCLYRIAIGHPLRLIGLHPLMDGIERRLPEVVAAAPGRDAPRGRKNQFDGYTVVGSLAGGGSGGKLYIAQPDELKNAAFIKRGVGDVQQVVIKTFSVHEGSTLPQIIRESRALDAAKRLGLILEHDLTNERFFYVMRYIPGDPLSIVTQRAHADANPEGLGDAALAKLLGYSRDVLLVLNRYHTGGLWHKDIKPDNIIVDHDQSEAHIVDLGLITPLRSAMTLTTHGTEYFRDPELVRMALKGVKVNEVNGEKFDIYAAAAVMYSAIEGSFPAHGGLSQISKRCPEAIRWIIRRGMTDYDKRYASVAEMLDDLDVVLAADNPFAVKPAMLPSLGGNTPEPVEAPEQSEFFEAAAAPQPAPQARSAEPTNAVTADKPKLRVTNWWTGGYDIEGELHRVVSEADQAIDEAMASVSPARRSPRPVPNPGRRSAKEQLKSARTRAAERRHRAVTRVKDRRRSLRLARDKASGLNPGAAIAIGCIVGLISIPVTVLTLNNRDVADASVAIARSAPGPTGALARAHIEARTSPAPPQPPRAAALPAVNVADRHASVLLVSTFNSPVPEAVLAEIQRGIAQLEAQGIDVVDNLTGDTADRLDIIADLRAARDLAPRSFTNAAKSMAAWFEQADPGFDALVLIEPDPDQAARGNTIARLIVADNDTALTESTYSHATLADRVTHVISD